MARNNRPGTANDLISDLVNQPVPVIAGDRRAGLLHQPREVTGQPLHIGVGDASMGRVHHRPDLSNRPIA